MTVTEPVETVMKFDRRHASLIDELRRNGDSAVDRGPAPEEIEGLLTADDPEIDQALWQAADEVRRRWMGDGVHLRGLIEFSNYCRRKCSYCGIGHEIKAIKRYRMTEEQIVETAAAAMSLGYRTLVLQSGEDPFYDGPTIARIVGAVKALGPAAITLSVGERPVDDYRLWREAGADRYLMRFETSDPALYARLHPGMSYEERFRCLRDLRETGYQVGSGFLIGLPGQSALMMAKDLLKLRELDVEMAGIGPFLPAPGTPLAHEGHATPRLCYRVIALARLLMPNVHLPATTAMGTLEPEGRIKALKAGANVVMPNVTPQPFRSLYQLYPNKICLDDTAAHCRRCIESQIEGMGRTVGAGPGHGSRRTEILENRRDSQWEAIPENSASSIPVI